MPDQQTPHISPWIKVPYTLFVCVLIPVYWAEYGPTNFLWASDIALIVTLVAAWTTNRLLASMMALAVLLPEVGWNVDFVYRLIVRPEAAEVAGTHYMFNAEVPLFVRALSLYHAFLPVILIWLVCQLGYQRKALFFQTVLAWIILPVTYVFTEPASNINWVFGIGHEPQTWLPEPLYVGLLMVLFPLVIYLPTHLVLNRLFGAGR
jgi:hypothetical protein